MDKRQAVAQEILDRCDVAVALIDGNHALEIMADIMGMAPAKPRKLRRKISGACTHLESAAADDAPGSQS